VVLSATYRLAPAFIFPEQIRDAAYALVWAQSHAAAYGYRPDNIVGMGESVGGNLVSMLAVLGGTDGLPPRGPGIQLQYPLRAVVAFYPVIDLNLETYGTFFESYVGDAEEDDPARWTMASPVHWISGREPPFLIIHGTWDVRVPLNVTLKFAEALHKAGAEAEVVAIPHADHRFLLDDRGSAGYDQALITVEVFLTRLSETAPP
jgi:acetyl esterase/lipase